MRSFTRIGLAILLLAQLSSDGFAQSGIITTYVGPQLPATGAQADSQAIDGPSSVALDGSGGLYVASAHQSIIYRVMAEGRLSVVAGNWTEGFSGDGGPAASAQLYAPTGVAVDTAGNLFIADTVNNRIRKVTTAGIISTVAGNGAKGFSGDGGLASSAQINFPYGIALDSAGNLFIADTHNNRVRKVTAAGIISTVVGLGTEGFNGDGGRAIAAQLNKPSGVAVDSEGNLYIAEYLRIRKVTPAGTISTVTEIKTQRFRSYFGSDEAGLATAAHLETPTGVAVDAADNLFIADTWDHRILKATPGGVISTVAGNGTRGFSGDGGPASSAEISGPHGVAVDMAGSLFIADTFNHRIRKVTPGGVISTVAGNGTDGFNSDGDPAAFAQIYRPQDVVVDAAGNLFISDMSSASIRKVTPGGVISIIAGNGTQDFSGDGGPAASAQLSGSTGVAMDAAGNLFIADTWNFRIRKVTTAGIISTVAGNGTGGFSGDGGPAVSAQLYLPTGVAIDKAGNLFISDTVNHRIRKATPGGVINTIAGNGIHGFSGDSGPAASAQLSKPCGVAVDAEGNLFIADMDNHRIRKVTPGGVISTVAGNGLRGFSGDGSPAASAQLASPKSVAVDSAGNLFIADTDNNRVRKVTTTGIISTVVGIGTEGFSGDGSPASSAQLANPSGVAVDAAGNLFIADHGNFRVRKVILKNTSTTFPPR